MRRRGARSVLEAVIRLGSHPYCRAERNSTRVFLRGVGAGLDRDNVEPNVAFNFDGTCVPREGTSVALFEVQQVEVLPGLRGTLHGCSAIGGTVNVAFRRPAFDSVGTALVEHGNNAALRRPLSHGRSASDSPATAYLEPPRSYGPWLAVDC